MQSVLLGLAALFFACPVGMGLMMWIMMRGQERAQRRPPARQGNRSTSCAPRSRAQGRAGSGAYRRTGRDVDPVWRRFVHCRLRSACPKPCAIRYPPDFLASATYSPLGRRRGLHR